MQVASKWVRRGWPRTPHSYGAGPPDRVRRLSVGWLCGGNSEAPKEKQGRTEVTKEQAHSVEATSEEALCGETRPIDWYSESAVTNDVPGCPNGDLLSGTEGQDSLDGAGGEDEVRGLGANDEITGGSGSDVLYSGPGDDFLKGNTFSGNDRYESKDVLHGGPGSDQLSDLDGGDDVLYGGDGDDAPFLLLINIDPAPTTLAD